MYIILGNISLLNPLGTLELQFWIFFRCQLDWKLHFFVCQLLGSFTFHFSLYHILVKCIALKYNLITCKPQKQVIFVPTVSKIGDFTLFFL